MTPQYKVNISNKFRAISSMYFIFCQKNVKRYSYEAHKNLGNILKADYAEFLLQITGFVDNPVCMVA